MNPSSNENIPPSICLPAMERKTDERPPILSFCTSNHHFRDSPKSISLLDIEDQFEVEITPDLAARFGADEDEHGPHASDFVTPRRRSLPQTAAFPRHLPFPSLDYPVKERLSPPIVSKSSAERSQWIMDSLEKSNVSAEQKRMNAAASVGIESIISGMRRHRDNARVQRYGCGALQKLACQSGTNRALIAEADGVLDILTAMERHPEKASIQERGCLALSFLSKATNGNACIAQYNGIETILGAMRAHMAHEAVQKHGCLVLLSVACSSANHNTAIARLGGIEDIMTAMTYHHRNTGIREYGSAALWSLAYMNSNNGTAIEKAGGLDAILDALHSMDNEQPPSLSQEDQCMQVINKQRRGESDELDINRRGGRHGVDAILSVFVRPLQQ